MYNIESSLPIIIWYMIKQPKFVIMTHTCAAIDPTCPNDSFMTPAYVLDSPECVNLIRNSTETSAKKAMITMSTKAGMTPNTLRVAGMDIIPAPIMLVDTLNTAPDTEPCLTFLCSGSSGAWTPAAGDIPMSNVLEGGRSQKWCCLFVHHFAFNCICIKEWDGCIIERVH